MYINSRSIIFLILFMKTYDQLGDFKTCSKVMYEQAVCQKEEENLYIYKLGFKNILVRLPKARKRIHDWRLKTIQVTQYGSEKGSTEKAVASIKFDGEMIFSLIDTFNKAMGRQILQYVDSIGSQLREWCEAPIKNVFKLTQRTEESLGFKHGFIKITPVLYHENKFYYFEYRRWIGNTSSQIPIIQSAEHVQGSSNYSNMFQYVCKAIHKERKYRQKKKLQKIQAQKQWQRRKNEKIPYTKYEEQQENNQGYEQKSMEMDMDNQKLMKLMKQLQLKGFNGYDKFSYK